MSNASPLQVGEPAPDFELPAYPEGPIKLSQYRGSKNVVLYFYPKDDTPGCTKEACGFRDELSSFDSAETAVLGVSADSVESHKQFAEKYSLPFPLLADENHEVCEKYGVWGEKERGGQKSMGIQRATFLIDKAGKVAAVWPEVNVEGHIGEVAGKLAELK